jgi:prepilin-type processing-associated H-X9-DG protein
MRRWVNVATTGSIVVLAAGLALAAVGRIHEAGNSTRCQNNLRQIGLGLSTYHDSYSRFPYAVMPSPDLPPNRRLSWLFELDPFIHSRMDAEWAAYREEPWDSDHNLKLVKQPFPWMICPSNPARTSAEGYTITTYVGVTGIGLDAARLPKKDPRAGFFGYDRKLTIADLGSGLATTVAAIETSHDNGPWMAGGWPTSRGFDPSRTPAIGRASQFGGLHRGGANVLFADGSVRFLADDTSPQALSKLITVVRD